MRHAPTRHRRGELLHPRYACVVDTNGDGDMSKTGWQVVAYLALAWATAASAIAWINKGQIEQRADPVSESAELIELRETASDLLRRNDLLTAEALDREQAIINAAGHDPSFRCIAGTRFHNVDGVLQNGGRC